MKERTAKLKGSNGQTSSGKSEKGGWEERTERKGPPYERIDGGRFLKSYPSVRQV